jgi:hypothetical protein
LAARPVQQTSTLLTAGQFFGSTRAASILPSRPLNLAAVARRACQGWPRLSRPPEGLGLDWPEHGGILDRIGLQALALAKFNPVVLTQIHAAGNTPMVNAHYGARHTADFLPFAACSRASRKIAMADNIATVIATVLVSILGESYRNHWPDDVGVSVW